MRISGAFIAVTFLGATLLVHAQGNKESGEPKIYKVEFEIHNGTKGEAKPSQHFSMLLGESTKGVFQAVTRVPADSGASSYIDVGANIECTVHESDGKAALSATIELTDITGHVNLSDLSEPIIGHRKVAFNTTVELGKRTLVTDDPSEAGTPAKSTAAAPMPQVEATVTKVN
jgi:hypothetical protein